MNHALGDVKGWNGRPPSTVSFIIFDQGGCSEMEKSFLTSRRRFMMAAGAGALGLTAAPFLRAAVAEEAPPGTPVSSKYPENRSSLTVPDPSRVKILQFTDIHFFAGRDEHGPEVDEKSVELIKRLVDQSKPDMLMLTGDTWHNNPDGKGKEFQEFALEKIGSLGIPTTYVWGNHDQLDDYVAGHNKFAEARNSLYRGGVSGGNYTVDLLNKTGERVWELVCLNSNDAGLQPQQTTWLEDLKGKKAASGEKPVPIHCFMHIPLLQYYYIWKGGLASGFKLEEVCSERENGLSLTKIKDLGPVKALFCGHDHVNDYSGLAEGIELAYGRATGYAGYGGEHVRKGGKLITINAQAGTYVWESIFMDGTTWHPDLDKRLDKPVAAPWMQWKES
jgi:3',5'-cyclic AMP phosphodiesterase CpdA